MLHFGLLILVTGMQLLHLKKFQLELETAERMHQLITVELKMPVSLLEDIFLE